MPEAQTCPHCGEKVEAEWVVCAYCGNPLKQQHLHLLKQPLLWVSLAILSLVAVWVVNFVIEEPEMIPGGLEIQEVKPTEILEKTRRPILSSGTSAPQTGETIDDEVASQDGVPKLMWSIETYTESVRTLLGERSTGTGGYAITPERIFVRTQNNRIQAIDIKLGEVIWTSDMGGQILGADAGNVYISPSSQRVDALEAATGQSKWTGLLPERINNTDLYAEIFWTVGNSVFVRTQPNWFVQLDRQSGQLLNTYSNFGLVGEIVIFDEKYVVSPETGQTVWEVSDQVTVKEQCDDLLVLSERVTNTVEAVDVKSGSSKWRIVLPFDEPLPPRQIICPRNVFGKRFLSLSSLFGELLSEAFAHMEIPASSSNIYLWLQNNLLTAVNRQNGNIQWLGKISDTAFLSSNNFHWLGEVNDIIVYSHDGFGLTQAFDAEKHQLLWENTQIVLEQIIGATEDILVGLVWRQRSSGREPPRTLIGLDIKTGEEKWRYEVDGFSRGDLLFNNLCYWTDRKVGLGCIDPDTGALKSFIPLNSSPQSLIPANGMIIVAQSSGVSIIKP